jgi:hypothetical protein
LQLLRQHRRIQRSIIYTNPIINRVLYTELLYVVELVTYNKANIAIAAGLIYLNNCFMVHILNVNYCGNTNVNTALNPKSGLEGPASGILGPTPNEIA